MAYNSNESIDTMKRLTFFVYLRRSSEDNEDRQMLSIPGQRKEIEEFIVKKYGLRVAGYFEESQSAFKLGRPHFNEMLERMEKGEAQGIIVWHPNRLARNYADGGRFVQMMSEGTIKVVLTC